MSADMDAQGPGGAKQPATATGGLSEQMLKVIRGEVSHEEKAQQYDASLGRWWSEYASRKNDEEQEHVADSLLYDERCHLPRTTPAPDVVKAAQQKQQSQQEH